MDGCDERAGTGQTIWNEFFNDFGIYRRSVASLDRTVRNLSGAYDRKLFAERLDLADFDADMRRVLLAASRFQ